MNEVDFIEEMTHYGLKIRDVIIPTSASILLYGDKEKTRIIDTKQHEHFYSLIKTIQDSLPDERLAQLQKIGKSDMQIIVIIQSEYDSYLKDTRRKIMSLQKSWSDSFAQQRARYIIDYLKYRNIFHICDLVNQRSVPYELILDLIFEIKSKYGEFRTETPRDEIYVDPRIREVLKEQDLIPAS